MGNSFNFFVEKVGLRGAKVTAEKLSESGWVGFQDWLDALDRNITGLIIHEQFVVAENNVRIRMGRILGWTGCIRQKYNKIDHP